ncbi:MAG: S-layer homology domain-containing protein [Clostridiales bacterium]|nr:S-layer homology domain-containing protein [Clostridiales bacterium]
MLRKTRKVLSIIFAFLLLLAFLPQIRTTALTAIDNDIYTFEVSGTFDYDGAYEMFTQLNFLRASVDAPYLILDKNLSELAMQRAAECAIYFSHTRPSGIDVSAEAGFSENISSSHGGKSYNADASLKSFMASHNHKTNMLNPSHRAVGIGCFNQGNGDFYWVQIFDNGKTVSPAPADTHGKLQETRSITALGNLLTLGVFPGSASIKAREKQEFIIYNAKNKGIPYSLRPSLDFDKNGVFESYGCGTCQIAPSYCKTSDSGIAIIDRFAVVTGKNVGQAILEIGLGDTLYKNISLTVLAGESPIVEENNEQLSFPFSLLLPFSDVCESDWFYEDVAKAYESGLINGTSATTFSPNDYLTYAEAVKLAVCMFQKYSIGSVALDNSDPWYQNYVDFAQANSIISQDYLWNTSATRAAYMEIFANALPESAFFEINTVKDNAIADVPMTSPYAAAIYKLYRAGIVQGVDADHNCDPTANIRRSEVATILTRMMDDTTRIR